MIKSYVGRALVVGEKYLKTDIKYLLRGSFWLSAGQLIASFSSFFLAIAFANLLPKELYGTYRYIISWVSILIVTTLVGSNTALIQAISRGYEGEFWATFWRKMRWGILGTIISFGLAVYYYLADNTTLAGAFLLSGILLPILKSSGLYLSVLYGRKEFKVSAIYTSLVRIIAAGTMILTLWLTDNLFIVILIYFIPETLIQLWLTHKILKHSPLKPGIDPSTNKYGLHLSIMEILKTAAGQVDKMLLFHYLGAAQLAVYSFALAAPNQIKGFLQNITSLALPKMSRSNEALLRKELPRKLFILEMTIGVIILAYIIVAPWLYQIFFPKYSDAIVYSQVAALSLLFLPRTFFSTALVAKQKQRELYSIRIIGPMIKIAIFFIAIRGWGVWGAVIGKLIGDLSQSGIYHYFFNRAFSEVDQDSNPHE